MHPPESTMRAPQRSIGGEQGEALGRRGWHMGIFVISPEVGPDGIFQTVKKKKRKRVQRLQSIILNIGPYLPVPPSILGNRVRQRALAACTIDAVYCGTSCRLRSYCLATTVIHRSLVGDHWICKLVGDVGMVRPLPSPTVVGYVVDDGPG